MNVRDLKDTDPMPFGTHRNKPMIDVPADYLLWLWNSGKLGKGNVRDYIFANMDALKKEVEEKKK